MKVAFSHWNHRIAPVFDTARHIHVIEIDAGKILNETQETLPADMIVQKSLQLVELGIGALVCGAVSRPMYDMINAYGIRVTAFVTPVEGGVLVERPSVLYSLCEEYDMDYIYLYAWNEMADGANIRDHREIWPEIEDLVGR